MNIVVYGVSRIQVKWSILTCFWHLLTGTTQYVLVGLGYGSKRLKRVFLGMSWNTVIQVDLSVLERCRMSLSSAYATNSVTDSNYMPIPCC